MPELNIEESRQLLSQHFGRNVEDIDTQELEKLYEEAMEQLQQTSYADTNEELLRALNLEMSSRRGS